MKVLINSVLVLLIIICSASCKKDFVCKCTQVYTEPAYTSNSTGDNHQGYQSVSTFTNVYKAKKDEGESYCKASENFQTYPSSNESDGQGPATEVVTCELQ
jgi:hypothetical protein